MASSGVPSDPYRSYRPWFFAAAVYNALWGVAASVAPGFFLGLAGFSGRGAEILFMTIGMMVGVYAYGYWLLARDPRRYAGLIWVGLAGKTFGPLGFLVSALRGDLAWGFGLTILLNDLIWWPAFWSFALRHARRPLDERESGGWRLL